MGDEQFTIKDLIKFVNGIKRYWVTNPKDREKLDAVANALKKIKEND